MYLKLMISVRCINTYREKEKEITNIKSRKIQYIRHIFMLYGYFYSLS